MMGPKKLSTIRQKLRTAIATTGKDPVRWLEQRIAEREAEGHEVLDSLLRLLKTPEPKKRNPGRRKK